MRSQTTILPDLPQLTWVQSIRDPIWDEIPITAVEKQIIQTETFNRLRGIKQLGFAYLAFPGAVHSRYEHSLGVMQATNMLLKMVRREENNSGLEIDSFARELLRLAALLHDIGHPPFSHAMERLFTYYPDLLTSNKAGIPAPFRDFLNARNYNVTSLGHHEIISEFLICNNEDILQVLGEWIRDVKKGDMPEAQLKEFIPQTIQNVIAKLAIGEPVVDQYVSGSLSQVIKLFKSIMSGDIDADKIDYLMRDNYYTGLAHGMDLTSLRDQLIPHADSLVILPGAIGFVHSLILARYQLITEVHHDQWDVFATAKAIDILQQRLRQESNPAAMIFDIFTKWDDSKLVGYLVDSKDPTIKDVLTTRYPLKEVTRLDYLDTHPYIRECVQVLSEPHNHKQIPELQSDLRHATGNQELFVHIQSVKSPEYSMRMQSGGSLLRDEILRGISEESIKHLNIIVYGCDDYAVDLANLQRDYPQMVPCEQCPIDKDCINNLAEDPSKQLIAELAVHRYRQISQDCGDRCIIAADFLLLIMEKVSLICAREDVRQPIRQDLYRIAKLVYDDIGERLQIHGALDLDHRDITGSFYQEIRKYEQMGLIAYSRQIRKLPSEEGPQREVFRFDRRFEISKFGKLRLQKVRDLYDKVPEYEATIKAWRLVEDVIRENETEIVEILLKSDALIPV